MANALGHSENVGYYRLQRVGHTTEKDAVEESARCLSREVPFRMSGTLLGISPGNLNRIRNTLERETEAQITLVNRKIKGHKTRLIRPL
jgi:hypothetical protein